MADLILIALIAFVTSAIGSFIASRIFTKRYWS